MEKYNYKGFEYSIKSYGIELYLPLSTQIFRTLTQMKEYINERLA